MWSIDYIAETAEEQTESLEGGSVDPASTSTDIPTEKDEQKLSVQDSEEVKSESEVKSERSESETKTEELQTEAAIKRVEELVKQMSLSQEKESMCDYLFLVDVSIIYGIGRQTSIRVF